MLKYFDDSLYLGLFFRSIPKDLINFAEQLYDGDVIKSECGTIYLRYTSGAFRLYSNDSREYVLAEDLKQPFKKL